MRALSRSHRAALDVLRNGLRVTDAAKQHGVSAGGVSIAVARLKEIPEADWDIHPCQLRAQKKAGRTRRQRAFSANRCAYYLAREGEVCGAPCKGTYCEAHKAVTAPVVGRWPVKGGV